MQYLFRGLKLENLSFMIVSLFYHYTDWRDIVADCRLSAGAINSGSLKEAWISEADVSN